MVLRVGGMMVLRINSLSLYNNLSFSFDEGIFYSIVGKNKSGKTTLCNLLSGYILTNNMIECDGIMLNKITRDDYIKKIGVVKMAHMKSFLHEKVYDEMCEPLDNLGYAKVDIKKRILKILDLFQMTAIINKRISDLTIDEKQILLIMISLLHQPKVLLLDNALHLLNEEMLKKVLDILKRLVHEEKICIINFTVNLWETYDSDNLLLLENSTLLPLGEPNKAFLDDKIFYDNNLELPITIDLENKLRMYNLISNYHDNMKDLVDEIWP